MLRAICLAALMAIAAVLAAIQAHAQSQPQSQSRFPERNITLIVPFPAGGITDIIGRIVAERMATSLGQPIVVENVSGAGGTIAVNRLHRSPADGYTLIIGQWTSHVGSGAMYKLPYDLVTDFEPISVLAIGAFWIIGRTEMPPKDTRELIAWLKANPDKASSGTIGSGSGIHMCLIYFQNQTGTKFPFVTYRGAAPIMQDMVANQLDLTCPEAGQTLSLYRAGKIKAFGVLSKKRWFAAPEVPTIEEAGVPGLDFPFWQGLWAPKATPKNVIARIEAAVREALVDQAVRKRLADLGQDIPPADQQSPAGLLAVHKADIEKWFPIIKAANIKAP